MSTAAQLNAPSRQHRYVVDGPGIKVTAMHTLGDRGSFDVKLKDISDYGVKIECSEPVRFSEHLKLFIRTEDLELDLAVDGEVRWIRATAHGTWVIGCYIAQALPEESLHKLGRAELMNRRREERTPVQFAAKCVKPGTSREISVTLQDVSDNGFRFQCGEDFHPGEPVRLHVGKSEVIAFSKWVLQSEDSTVTTVGCAVTPQSASRYLDLVETYILPTQVQSKSRSPLVFGLLLLGTLAASALVLIALLSQ